RHDLVDAGERERRDGGTFEQFGSSVLEALVIFEQRRHGRNRWARINSWFEDFERRPEQVIAIVRPMVVVGFPAHPAVDAGLAVDLIDGLACGLPFTLLALGLLERAKHGHAGLGLGAGE